MAKIRERNSELFGGPLQNSNPHVKKANLNEKKALKNGSVAELKSSCYLLASFSAFGLW